MQFNFRTVTRRFASFDFIHINLTYYTHVYLYRVHFRFVMDN